MPTRTDPGLDRLREVSARVGQSQRARDDLIRQLSQDGATIEQLIEASGLKRRRIYQIRNGV